MSAFQAFMSQLIDYAGLFPPAQLPLNEAITNYSHYQQHTDSWLLSHFIIPATRLNELSTIASSQLTTESPYQFSILGQSGVHINPFNQNLQEDMDNIVAFRQRHGQTVNADLYETRLPSVPTEQLVDLILPTIVTAHGHRLHIFLELPRDENWVDNFLTAAQTIAIYADQHPTGFQAGLKIRCGGLTPDTFPTPTEIAHAIVACQSAGIPFKATAGLHHPVRHFNNSVNTTMHGFLNLFGAALCAHHFNLNDYDVLPIIEDENPDNFIFTADAFQWGEYTVPAEAITLHRQKHLISYGSCSFDEPREDLQALGLL
ncbi:MAG TPA: hypothetical protein VLL52_20025 [Anaerolineae bacterium]|nr:hypothetical protein [Anaerolineae bacterium]